MGADDTPADTFQTISRGLRLERCRRLTWPVSPFEVCPRRQQGVLCAVDGVKVRSDVISGNCDQGRSRGPSSSREWNPGCMLVPGQLGLNESEVTIDG